MRIFGIILGVLLFSQPNFSFADTQHNTELCQSILTEQLTINSQFMIFAGLIEDKIFVKPKTDSLSGYAHPFFTELAQQKLTFKLEPQKQKELFKLHYKLTRSNAGLIKIKVSQITYSLEAAELLASGRALSDSRAVSQWLDVLILDRAIRSINDGSLPLEYFNIWDITRNQQIWRFDLRPKLPTEFVENGATQFQLALAKLVWPDVKTMYENQNWTALFSELAFSHYLQFENTYYKLDSNDQAYHDYLEQMASSSENYYTKDLNVDAGGAFQLLGKLAALHDRLGEVKVQMGIKRYERLDAKVRKQMELIYGELRFWIEGNQSLNESEELPN